MIDPEKLFEHRMGYPHPSARDRLDRLVGIDEQKDKLAKILGLLVHPKRLKDWAAVHHGGAEMMLDAVLHRPPLVILAGDVGSGKTELAESIGDEVARRERIDVVLLPLSLAARGQGKVGEITTLISAAFDVTVKEAMSFQKLSDDKGAVILLVDEADALAQSRETAQMHHEDKSGVNAFIRGIDRLANQRLPAAVIMCTNRYHSLDPAVKRRAADVLLFGRPDDRKRLELLAPRLGALGFAPMQVESIVAATGPRNGHPGFTYSDLMQRLIPAIVLDAFPDRPIEPSRALSIAQEMTPSPAFRDEQTGIL